MTTEDLARTDHANQLARQAIINRLAAHGILGSGELGYDEGEQGRTAKPLRGALTALVHDE